MWGKNNPEFFQGGEINDKSLGKIDIDGWRRRKAMEREKTLSSGNQHGKNSGYIRWQAAKVVDGGRWRAKLLLLFFFGSNFACHYGTTDPLKSTNSQKQSEQRLHLPWWKNSLDPKIPNSYLCHPALRRSPSLRF